MIHTIMLLDESGSMGTVAEDVVGGFNSYIATMKKEKGEACVSLYTFDKGNDRPIVREKFSATLLHDVKRLKTTDYMPSGTTPLNDAVITTIKRVKESVSKTDTVIFVIYTDGYENASKATSADVQEKIRKMEKRGWDFVYLGSNQDAWDAGGQIGVGGLKLNTSGTGVGTAAMFVSAGNMMNTARRATAQGVYSVGEGGTLDKAYKGKDIGDKPVDDDDNA